MTGRKGSKRRKGERGLSDHKQEELKIQHTHHKTIRAHSTQLISTQRATRVHSRTRGTQLILYCDAPFISTAAECVNNEGLKSWYIADGANAAYTAASGGMEYDAVFPVWDWRKVRWWQWTCFPQRARFSPLSAGLLETNTF